MLKDVYQALDALFPQMDAWRRHLHMHPELSFHKEETSAFVAEKLRSFSIDVRTVYDPARVVEMPPKLGGEDFAGYLQKVPGRFSLPGPGTPISVRTSRRSSAF